MTEVSTVSAFLPKTPSAPDKMRKSQLALLTALVVVIQLVGEAQPQSVQVNNQALFTLGAVALAAGLGYHFGQKSTNNRRPQSQFGNQGFVPGFFRRRRQAEPENELDPLVTKLFKMALDKDSNNCSLRLTCKIGTKPLASLSGHARNLFGLLSKENEKPTTVSKEEFQGIDAYKVALNLGRDGGDCDQLFPRCTSTSGQLMQVFQNLKVSPN
ncbi:uncharacterized protein LOC122253481 [Penaeus japonicus]|uniref:uncharacterized protein LOC122253481 n=1 Tax=Penaeus japonicus TaxID=27405 RepID=UPI001C714CA4|nr:uncharacterized protein LOC122253481 [Penaeus japonicus]